MKFRFEWGSSRPQYMSSAVFQSGRVLGKAVSSSPPPPTRCRRAPWRPFRPVQTLESREPG
eukprot:1067649-Pyramimonas_sp.AAC.1